MPDTDTQPQAAVAVADPPAQSSPGSTAVADRPTVGSANSFENVFAKALAGVPKDDPRDEPVSKAGAAPAAPVTATAQDAKPVADTPSADVTASDAEAGEAEAPAAVATEGQPLSRRAEAAAKSAARIAELEAQVAALDPATLREQVRAEIAAEETQRATAGADEDFLGNQARYEQLLAVPDADLSADDYIWREDRKARRAQYAPVERHFRAIYDQKVAEAQTSVQRWQQNHHGEVMGWVASQIGDASKLPHVDASKWQQPGQTFADYARSLYDGGAQAGSLAKEAELTTRVTKAEAEAARLAKDNEDLRLNALAGTTAPATVGRSGAGGPQRPTADPKGSWQDNLSAAFGWSATSQ